ncbi:UNVERIFIED_CONTAM: hypothetical protein Sradi_4877400 [Sesamum radiatum]|uniref:Uncharacterized protein n=1 Tax=Sesamum radiatum TaxID=300843 RepID=A0AAW2N194_SESRA
MGVLESDGEEEPTPISNRFQSLEDMKMEDILQHIENMQTSITSVVGKEVERGEDDGQFHKTQSIAIPGPQEGEATQQAIIFKDSATTNKQKSNKSLEGITKKSMKIDGKGKKGKVCVDMQMIQDHEQFLHLKVNLGALQEDIFCTFVYAKCYRNFRRLLWEELTNISNLHAPWLVGGILNVILHPNENKGGDMRRMGPIDDFNDMMIDTGLMDAGFEGDLFTWTNKRVWKRLDRVLYSKEWTHTYNSTRVQHLSRRLSDHYPLFITAAKTENRKPSSFRFQNMWLNHHSFLNTVRQAWNLSIKGYGMYKLQQKIYRTKELLKQWNREVFGNIFTTVEHAKQEAEEAEKNFDRDPSKANLIALNKGNTALVYALSLESEYWRQKSNCTSTRNDTPDSPFQFSKLSQDELLSISNIPT